MTPSGPVAEWLATREPVPPRQLAARIDVLVADRSARAPAAPDAPVAERLIDAAEDAMRAVLQAGCLTRDSALELLAVDAIVTYAFEASADQPERLEELASAALSRIAALAEPYDA